MVGGTRDLKYFAIASSSTMLRGSRGMRWEMLACVCMSIATSSESFRAGWYLAMCPFLLGRFVRFGLGERIREGSPGKLTIRLVANARCGHRVDELVLPHGRCRSHRGLDADVGERSCNFAHLGRAAPAVLGDAADQVVREVLVPSDAGERLVQRGEHLLFGAETACGDHRLDGERLDPFDDDAAT